MNLTPQQNWNEQDLLTDILAQEKYLMSVYTDSIKESSCPELRDLLMCNMHTVTQDQYQVFDEMNKKGLYPIKTADDQEVQTIKDKAAGMAQTLPV